MGITNTQGHSRRVVAQSAPRLRLTRRGRIVVVSLAAIPLLVGFGFVGRRAGVDIVGIEDGSVVGAIPLRAEISTTRSVGAERITVTLDGEPVAFTFEGQTGSMDLGSLDGGTHRLEVTVDGRLFDSTAGVDFEVDAAAPVLELLAPVEAVRVSESVVVEVAVDDPTATVDIGGMTAAVAGGIASATFDTPPRAPVTITATDEFGNQASLEAVIPIRLAGAPGQEPVRGVHATGYTWATPELRQPILDAIADGLINTVQLDIKDEAGDIWYDTRVDLAHEIGAVTVLWDLEQVVRELHALDVRVIGRVVNFRDPRLANYAIETGEMDWVVQNPDGTAFGKYGGFTNPYDREVWEYNIAISEEAARLGVDDILYDYVRRPDQAIEDMVFPGQDSSPEEAIVAFLEASRARIHAAGARLGASVFGIAATRPTEIAQDIPQISHVVDYVAPMVYPSHWGPGEYGVANPNAQPYDIVYESMLDFVIQTRDGGAGIIVWLQDFSLGVDYGPAEVRAQIEAAAAAGVDAFLLWDPKTTYTWSALGG